MSSKRRLTETDLATYEWQMWVKDFGRQGQEKLKGSTVLISRVGGVGSVVAYELAAAGVGQLVLAHGGNIKHSDLNRQLLMTSDMLGTSRVKCAEYRLKELNPNIKIKSVPENVSRDNARKLIEQVDLVVDCAPLFKERFAMNREIVRQKKPMVECAMYDMEAHLTTIIPGQTPCLSCLYPEDPEKHYWKREFPVFGAVSGTVACMAAVEAIKILAGFGKTLAGYMMSMDLRHMEMRKFKIMRDEKCQVCSGEWI